jgi:hypothetical protein
MHHTPERRINPQSLPERFCPHCRRALPLSVLPNKSIPEQRNQKIFNQIDPEEIRLLSDQFSEASIACLYGISSKLVRRICRHSLRSHNPKEQV